MKRIFFTGGGTAGHVTPNLALIERCLDDGWDVHYVGSRHGIERQLVSDIPFHGIATGKLRRYFSWQNFTDPFRIAYGLLQGIGLCLRHRPAVVFSKGGFVAVPIVIAAWLCRIPVIAHESDTTPGLATRLCKPFARKVCVNFEQTLRFLPPHKGVVTGSPVRRAILDGDASRAQQALGLSGRPVLLVFGGSLGAATINRAVRECLDPLCERFDVVHAAGAGNIDPAFEREGYWQRDYISEGFGDVLAAADVVVSRAGANSIYELLVTRTPHVLVPLPLASSRGDQIENAEAFEALGMSVVVRQEDLTPARLLSAIEEAHSRRDDLMASMATLEVRDSVGIIIGLIESLSSPSMSS